MSTEQLGVLLDDKLVSISVEKDDTIVHEIVEKRKNIQMKEKDDNSFTIVNIGHTIRKYDEWTEKLPNVVPFYAIKCNKDPVIIKVLAQLGTGFDCASMQEIEQVLSMGVPPEKIIFANPCKMISHIKYAAMNGVKMMTFDHKSELYKLQEHFGDAELVLRFRPNDEKDDFHQIPKYGCSTDNVLPLLKLAKELKLNVIGISFYVGREHTKCLKQSLAIFRQATTMGYKLSLLDIGGGYPGYEGSEPIFNKIAEAIKEELRDFVREFQEINIISEPGRFFTNFVNTTALKIHSKKTEQDGTNVYYISDGVFGTFSVCPYFPDWFPQPNSLQIHSKNAELFPSVIWGPTCGPDKLMTTSLPELEIGDWLYFKDMGAYTTEFGSLAFCGFPRPKCYYIVTSQHKGRLLKMFQ